MNLSTSVSPQPILEHHPLPTNPPTTIPTDKTFQDHTPSTFIEPAQPPDLAAPPPPPNSPPLKRSTRICHPSTWFRDYHHATLLSTSQSSTLTSNPPQGTRYPHANLLIPHQRLVESISARIEPVSYHQTASDLNWAATMRLELQALEDNGTWTYTLLPTGKKPIGCKWVYKIRYQLDGTIERYKARLVAKGYTQVEGQDYRETFARIAKLITVRSLLAIAVAKGWSLH